MIATKPSDIVPECVYPLGARADAPLDDDQLRVMAALADFNLNPVRERLLCERALPPHRIDEALLEFRRYLSLTLVSPAPIAMFSKPVDAVWHAALIHTRLYAELCARSVGYFVHHEPGRSDDPQADWGQFEAAYRTLFGDPGRIWQRWRPAAAGGAKKRYWGSCNCRE